MTAKIKLNAASGGGSVSIQAPSSSSNNRVISLPDIADGTLVTSQSTLDATKLSGALPAISGANLTGISAGITMYDVWQYSASPSGDQTPLSGSWGRTGNFFDKIGTGMSESSGIFSFPTTGKYHIWYKINFYSNSNSSQYAGAYFQVTPNNSSYTTRSHSYAYFSTTSGYQYDTAYGDIPVDVTDISNIKIRLNAGMQNQNVNVMGSSDSITTGITFMRLGDT